VQPFWSFRNSKQGLFFLNHDFSWHWLLKPWFYNTSVLENHDTQTGPYYLLVSYKFHVHAWFNNIIWTTTVIHVPLTSEDPASEIISRNTAHPYSRFHQIIRLCIMPVSLVKGYKFVWSEKRWCRKQYLYILHSHYNIARPGERRYSIIQSH
jgi:hypothetical protein